MVQVTLLNIFHHIEKMCTGENFKAQNIIYSGSLSEKPILLVHRLFDF